MCLGEWEPKDTTRALAVRGRGKANRKQKDTVNWL